jgi:hypothetical protein
MGVDPRHVEGVRSKLLRAYEHLKLLEIEMNAFNGRQPYSTIKKVNVDQSEHIFRLKLCEEIPARWGVILGEAVHDMRSALDQSINLLSTEWTGHPVKNSHFPIFTDPDAFGRTSKNHPTGAPGSGLYGIRGIDPKVREVVERLQPYQGRNTDLLTLHLLWNQDKHNIVGDWGAQTSGDSSNITIVNAVGPCEVTVQNRIIHDGEELIRLRFDGPNPQAGVLIDLPFSTSIEDPADPGQAGSSPLWRVFDASLGATGLLLSALGNQTLPMLSL